MESPQTGSGPTGEFSFRISPLENLEKVRLQFVERALSEFRKFSEKFQGIHRLTLRLQAASLTEIEFPERLVPLAKKFGVPLHKIGIDVSGIGSLDQRSSPLQVMTRLRMKGIELAVGEYGGAIGIQQLRQISATELKIDGRIVQNIFASERDSIMAQKIILIAHELNIKAVAEGVETKE